MKRHKKPVIVQSTHKQSRPNTIAMGGKPFRHRDRGIYHGPAKAI